MRAAWPRPRGKSRAARQRGGGKQEIWRRGRDARRERAWQRRRSLRRGAREAESSRPWAERRWWPTSSGAPVRDRKNRGRLLGESRRERVSNSAPWRSRTRERITPRPRVQGDSSWRRRASLPSISMALARSRPGNAGWCTRPASSPIIRVRSSVSLSWHARAQSDCQRATSSSAERLWAQSAGSEPSLETDGCRFWAAFRVVIQGRRGRKGGWAEDSRGLEFAEPGAARFTLTASGLMWMVEA